MKIFALYRAIGTLGDRLDKLNDIRAGIHDQWNFTRYNHFCGMQRCRGEAL
jgi:hypothetical protein